MFLFCGFSYHSTLNACGGFFFRGGEIRRYHMISSCTVVHVSYSTVHRWTLFKRKHQNTKRNLVVLTSHVSHIFQSLSLQYWYAVMQCVCRMPTFLYYCNTVISNANTIIALSYYLVTCSRMNPLTTLFSTAARPPLSFHSFS